MDESTINQLLGGTSGGTSAASSLNLNSIMSSLAPFMIALTVVSILITVLYFVSIINKWRANKAIIDIKKILTEMNERDKVRLAPQTVDTTTLSPLAFVQPSEDTVSPPIA